MQAFRFRGIFNRGRNYSRGELDKENKTGEIKMKKIMITGCNGQLGRALNHLYEKEQRTTIITGV